jgi:hypothetical protein
MGAAKDGVWLEAQIRQTDDAAGADRSVLNWCAVCSGANSQQSRACATVVINSRPMHREAHQASNPRDAAARHWLLVISRK